MATATADRPSGEARGGLGGNQAHFDLQPPAIETAIVDRVERDVVCRLTLPSAVRVINSTRSV